MTRLVLPLVGAAFAAFVFAPASFAGPVTSASGNVRIDFQTDFDTEFGTGDFPVAFPESATREYNGLIEGNDNSGVGGLGRVTYGLTDSADGARMDVDASHHNEGGFTAQGGHSTFTLDFTTDRAVRYSYVANVDFPVSFESSLSSGNTPVVLATAQVIQDVVNGPQLQGSIPHDRLEFDTFTQEGVLAAGTYRFIVSAESGVDSRELQALDSRGHVLLTLEADAGPGPTPVPLPAAFWPALATLAAGLVARASCPWRAVLRPN